MFVKVTKQGYDKYGQQFAHGYFLMLMSYSDVMPAHTKETEDGRIDMRARIVYARMSQLGHFMMASVVVKGHHISLSGTYGGDGLCVTVPKEVWDTGIPVPSELYDEWNSGGHNGPGKEAKHMHEFGLKLLSWHLRYKRKYVYDHYKVDLRQLVGSDFDSPTLADLAINEARERAKLYVMPCIWYAKEDKNIPGLFYVTRKRNKPQKKEQ
jgi:hypothetical protein